MFIKITDSETGNNKSSSARLVEYLEKENKLKADNKQQELWFTNGRFDVSHQEVRVKIDNNIAKLCHNDDKFFLVNISPSEKEIIFLKEKYTQDLLEEKLKEYAISVMDIYAQNFKKESVKTSSDLLWYGKLEHFRYYSNTDEKVKNGESKTGDIKPGEQMHIQIIVSRKDITNKIKLSPKNNSRGKNAVHSAKFGQFDNLAFKENSENLFDQMFEYQRELKDTILYSLTMKNDKVDDKKSLELLNQIEENLKEFESEKYFKILENASLENIPLFEDIVEIFNFESLGILDGLLSSKQDPYDENKNLIFKRKRKRLL